MLTKVLMHHSTDRAENKKGEKFPPNYFSRTGKTPDVFLLTSGVQHGYFSVLAAGFFLGRQIVTFLALIMWCLTSKLWTVADGLAPLDNQWATLFGSTVKASVWGLYAPRSATNLPLTGAC